MRALAASLQQQVPDAELVLTRLPQVPEIELFLLQQEYPQDRLSAAQTEALMDSPPYWCFCWASGQVLARYLLANTELVRNRTVVDFGAGSGVVAIAASLAGADRVIACDNDPAALRAISVNSVHNNCVVEGVGSIEAAINALAEEGLLSSSLICIADVFYDRENLPLLSLFTHRFDGVLVADSRLNGAPLPGMRNLATYASCTVPDLNESKDFNRVALYESFSG